MPRALLNKRCVQVFRSGASDCSKHSSTERCCMFGGADPLTEWKGVYSLRYQVAVSMPTIAIVADRPPVAICTNINNGSRSNSSSSNNNNSINNNIATATR